MKYKDQPSQSRSGWFWFIVGAAVVISIAGLCWLAFMMSTNTTEIKSRDQPTSRSTSEPLTSRLLVVGDVFWGRSIQKKAEASGKGAAYLTSGLDPVDRATYDAWIANFECPITYRDVSYAQQIESLKFNCRPEYLPELAKWFTAVSLANNHTDNNGGQAGLEETRTNLQKVGIQYFGDYDVSNSSNICEVVSLPAKRKGGGDRRLIPVALCGYHLVVSRQPTVEQLAVMEQYSRFMPVIAVPHMGVEYRATAESEKTQAYRNMIDNGASVVIAAHPHVIQNSEIHHGKLIVYSTGNFLFDQQSLGKDTSIGLGVQLDLTIDDGRNYQKLGDCSMYKDDCLQRLLLTKPTRPTVKVEYSFRCFDMTKGVPTTGTEQVCSDARQRAGVEKLTGLSKQL